MTLFAAIRREYIYLSTIARTLWMLRLIKPDATHSIVDIVEDWARKTPQAPAIYYLDSVMSYGAMDARANQYAHWSLSLGLKQGDPVALFMENRPDFLCAWLGLFKAGLSAALINTNQRGQPLAHSIEIAGARHVIVGDELAACLPEAGPFFTAKPQVWTQGNDGNLDAALNAAPSSAPGQMPRAGVTLKDRAFLIYTSGTTGLPKAANFSHMRMLFMMTGFLGALEPKASDRIYNALPLYHATGGVCTVGLAFNRGGALILKKKFSVSEFWNDIHKYNATMFTYIGEVCRYLLNAPPGPHERGHHIRAITGNGLRPEIWREFQSRFAIPRIVEFYGATEGNVSMLNYDGTIGAVGRVPEYIEWLLPTRVARFDVEKETPVRGPAGLCIECEPDEVGEAVGGISARAGRNFEGYTKASDTEKKILRDVFRKGDAWFRTGDLMRRDRYGYFYFVDRIGDTFRWKGENVATSEVTEALSTVPGIREANVYGVAVPGMDGRAGMAALVVDGLFDVRGLARRLEGRLVHYARPVFLRLQSEIAVTGTFKQRKVELVKEGFDPSALPDPIYWLDPVTADYERLTPARYGEIVEDRVKL
ncbi:MAG TPA: long-chain-acyl-CoA synthetase [Rhizomicrobium sp.]|nr:long-chain-acyl-CoA synthetase [Rhizomicrobium sp.]